MRHSCRLVVQYVLGFWAYIAGAATFLLISNHLYWLELVYDVWLYLRFAYFIIQFQLANLDLQTLADRKYQFE